MNARRGAWFELCLLCCLAWARPAHAGERTAFYYGHQLPSDLVAAYDQLVVEPDHLADLSAFEGRGAQPIAYASIGEVARTSRRYRDVQPAWVIAENRAWSSAVMDLTHPEYQAYLERRFEELWSRGYRGFFLDTLDSYRLAAAPERDAALKNALVQIIRKLHQRHPEARLLLNRGFELLPELPGVVNGVVAESLFDRWDAATQRYRRVPEQDRRWLAAELSRARDRLGLPVTVIDYRPASERVEARETARKIQALGFEPWVTNSALDEVGVGSLEILPRRVLILTNETGAAPPDAPRLLAPVLEYLGYLPEHRRVPKDLSELALDQGYAGVITWFSSPALPPGYAEWMAAARRRGVRFVLFGVPGFDVAGPDARELGLSLVAPASGSSVSVAQRDALVGFECEPPARPFDGPLVQLSRASGSRVHLALKDGRGRVGVAVATTDWGGFALSHALALRGMSGERAWVIDPVEFLRDALALPDAPMPNITTLEGRRAALISVHPEGLAALAAAGQPTVAAALGDWLRANHAWPHSVATTASDPATPVLPVDAAAAQSLLALGFFERAELRPGSMRARGPGASLTQLNSTFAGDDIVGPIALDSLYLPSGASQAYPYRDVLQTFAFTDAPRRYAAVFVDYHAYLIESQGGRSALAAIYGWLEGQELFPLFVSEYIEMARAFRQQVVARGLDGSFHFFGGERSLSVRSPLALGWPRAAASAAALVARRGPDGVYASFVPGGRRELTFGEPEPGVPFISQTNGRVLAFTAVEGKQEDGQAALVRLELAGHVPLELELGGLPSHSRCELRFARGQAGGVSDERGSLRLNLQTTTTGAAELACRTQTGNG
jgi:hypothetical protein